MGHYFLSKPIYAEQPYIFLKNADICPADYRAVTSQKTVIYIFSGTGGKVSILISDSLY